VRRHAGDDVRHVVVIGETAAGEPPARRFGRRASAVPAEPPVAPAPVTRVTVIEGAPLPDAATAAAWLAGAGERVAADALAVLVRVAAAQRVAAADPSLADPDPRRALAARVGYGSGEQVADGDWEAARALPPPPGPRRRDLRPQQRLAALLTGRDAALACEELALRARADVDAGRSREAALQLEAALTAALAELEGWRGHADLAARLGELATHRDAVAGAAAAARAGTLDPPQAEAVAAALARLEAALRARAAVAGD
jgi:hypothetical protein